MLLESYQVGRLRVICVYIRCSCWICVYYHWRRVGPGFGGTQKILSLADPEIFEQNIQLTFFRKLYFSIYPAKNSWWLFLVMSSCLTQCTFMTADIKYLSKFPKYWGFAGVNKGCPHLKFMGYRPLLPSLSLRPCLGWRPDEPKHSKSERQNARLLLEL